MNSKIDSKIAFLIIGLVAGAAVGYVAFNNQIVDLQGKLASSQVQYVSLYSQYQLLTGQKTELQANYDNLSKQKNELESKYLKLQNDYARIRAYSQIIATNFARARANFTRLSDNITTLQDTLDSYCFLPDSFTRTLNDNEVQKVGDIVKKIVGNEPNNLGAYDVINTYIVGHVTNTYDVLFPYIQPYVIDFNGTKVIASFKIAQREEYIRTPEFTLKYMEGDSECQTVLEYAMMKYYDRYIRGAQNDAYLTSISFSDGTMHSAVFVPGQRGQICIFDPAGGYRTMDYGMATYKIAAAELGAYWNYWDSRGQEIKSFTLYKVNTIDGSSIKVFEGSLSSIIAFFSS